MELEPKHLSPYLPYGLKICSQLNLDEDYIICEIGVTTKVNVFTIDYVIEYGYKPLLRPLSDLTKEIEHNGDRFVPNEVLGSPEEYTFQISYEGGKGGDIRMLDHGGMQHLDAYIRTINKLYEWHFDVFSLLENNLAIDYNKVNK